MSVQICTVIARNYLPAARVLAASFLEHHPDGQRERAQESAWADPGFHGAFAPGEGPVLVLKAINGEQRPADLEALKLLATSLDQPGSVPAQLLVLEEWTLDRLSWLDARLQQLNHGLGERPDRLAQTVDPSGGYHGPLAGEAPAFDAGGSARGQELGGGTSSAGQETPQGIGHV